MLLLLLFCVVTRLSALMVSQTDPSLSLSLPPRILFSTPLAVLCYFLIWYVPPFEDGKVIWYLVFYCLFQTMQTVSSTPRMQCRYPSSCTWGSVLTVFPWCSPGVPLVFPCSVSTFPTRPLPCSSATNRRRGTPPRHTVSPAPNQTHPTLLGWHVRHWDAMDVFA